MTHERKYHVGRECSQPSGVLIQLFQKYMLQLNRYTATLGLGNHLGWAGDSFGLR